MIDTNKHSCKVCQQRHHSLLHADSVSSSGASHSHTASPLSAEATESDSATIALSSISVTARPSAVLLATARVSVSAPTGRALVIRALLDQGSEVTFITERLSQLLRLPRTRTVTTSSAVGCANVGTCKFAARVILSPRDGSTPQLSTTAFILKSLTKYAPRITVGLSEWPHLANLYLADDDPTGSTTSI